MEIEITSNKVEEALNNVKKAMKLYYTMTKEEQDLFFVEYDKLAKEEGK